MIEAAPIAPPTPVPVLPECFVVLKPFHDAKFGWLWIATVFSVGDTARHTSEYQRAEAEKDANAKPGAVVVRVPGGAA